ncbi:hypothetical protein ACEZ3G_02330 [Maribacter algicola]|uniref:Uncharacterized protein n=1 Tax=Meishania litoralis TaxID=3434685 RepID=A0ACC7LFT1_9FLAO
MFGQENAVWTESLYLRGYRPSTGRKLVEKDLRDYANILKENDIKYAYIFAGPFKKDGHLPQYPFSEQAKRSVSKIKEYYPEIRILPWIGGVQNKTVYLGDSVWVENALEDTQKLVETLGVSGIHIDFEYILKGDPYLDLTIEAEKQGDRKAYGKNVNLFHKKLRRILPNAFISSVVVSTSPNTKQWKRKTTIEELNVLLRYVDQLSFLFYDTQINKQQQFELSCIEQIRDIKILKKLNGDSQFLMAIGTFINRPELHKYRNLEIESISNTIATIKNSSISVDTSMRVIDGIAIFCDWETDNSEWEEFRNNWVGDN